MRMLRFVMLLILSFPAHAEVFNLSASLDDHEVHPGWTISRSLFGWFDLQDGKINRWQISFLSHWTTPTGINGVLDFLLFANDRPCLSPPNMQCDDKSAVVIGNSVRFTAGYTPSSYAELNLVLPSPGQTAFSGTAYVGRVESSFSVVGTIVIPEPSAVLFLLPLLYGLRKRNHRTVGNVRP